MKSRNDICKLRLARARSRTDYIPTMSSSDNGAPVEPAVAPPPDAGPARDERAPRYQVVQDRSPHGMMIEEQAARLAAIVRSSDHAIYSTSRDDVVETWNRGAERLYGYASAEVVGQSILTIIPAQCRAEHEEMLRRVLAGNWSVESFHSVRLTKAGQLVPVSIMISPIGEPDGMVVGVAVVAQDISEQVKLQERLVVADRMTSVGTLAAGVAHEINNPLASVTANLEMALEELQLAMDGGATSLHEIRQLTLDAQAGAERIRKIVRSLMTFSRAEEEQRVVLDLRAVVELSVDIAISHIRPCARLVKDYGASPTVMADDARLGQVFMHLLVNAAQAIGEGDVEAHEIRITTSTDDAGRAVVEVRDTGPGLPTGFLGRLFDPFFTTKPIGGGVGLGLSVCRNIVTAMGGEITASNNEGRGATFRVVLPAAPAPLAPEEAPDAKGSGRRGRLLIVDDEPLIGASLARLLRRHDVTVLTRASEALALIAAGKCFDLILSDLMMPEMSGAEFYEQLVARFPDVAPRVVFVTGGAFSPSARAFLDRVANERLNKPVDAQVLRALVQRRLS